METSADLHPLLPLRICSVHLQKIGVWQTKLRPTIPCFLVLLLNLSGKTGGTGAIMVKIKDVIICIPALLVCFIQTFSDTTVNDAGDFVLDNFKLMAKWVTYLKLFVNTYSGLKTKGSEVFGFVCLLGFFLQSHVITTHINSNHRAWARTSISGMAILSTVGGVLLTMVHLEVHAWHNTAVETVRIFFISLEACLLVYSKRNEDGDNQNSNWNLLIISVDTLITSYRFFDSIAKTHSPWDTEKFLHLVGAGLPVLIGTCHFFWILYKAHIRPKAVVGWLVKIPRVFARKTEQAAGATMGGNGGRDAVDQVADELVEVGNGLPVTTGASQVGWIVYTAGIKFKVIKWFRKNRRVFAAEAVQAAGTAMDNYGGGDSEQQVQEEDVASLA